jgi:acyl carrier protein
MEKKVFFEELEELLEIQNGRIDEDTDLTELEEYDSLMQMSLVALIDENFGKKVQGRELQSVTTVRSLMVLIGEELFE